MAKIYYDRKIGPTTYTEDDDATTTTLSVDSQSTPTVTASNQVNFVYVLSSVGLTTTTTPGTCTDTQGSTYSLIKEVKFSGFALDVFARSSTTTSIATTITATHQPANFRIIAADEWFNLSGLEKTSSSFASSPIAQVDVGDYKSGNKDWLNVAVLGIGGDPYEDTITIPDGWSLMTDVGTDEGTGEDIRLVVCYQISDDRKKIDFRPVLSTARVWGVVTFAYKGR